MKKTILTLILAAFTVCGFSQKFYTVDAQLVDGTTKYTRKVSDSLVVDSVKATYNCYFGQVGNPYVKKVAGGWEFCAFVQLTQTIKGNPTDQYLLNFGKKYAEIYRQKNYPDIK